MNCTQKLPTTAFDTLALQIWQRHRDLSRRATCKKCAAEKGQKIARPREDWKLASYRCATCGVTKAAKFYDYTILKKMVDENKSYLAKCAECQPSIEIGQRSRMVVCNLCGEKKERSEFSLARQRSSQYAFWRCKTCDFPACTHCGRVPTTPKQKPYVCPACLFPPCACGAPRPTSTKYRVTNRPTWTCGKCRGEPPTSK